MAVTITARMVDPTRRRVEALTPDGHGVIMDADPPDGDGSGAGPKEALLSSLAGCTAMDVAALLVKKRQHAERYEIAVTGIEADEHPRVFTSITVVHIVSGDVDPEALRRSIELSATRYCPVNAMLSATVSIEHRYRLERSGGPATEAVVVRIGPAAAAGG